MALADTFAEQKQTLINVGPVLNEIADQVIMPAMARNYASSGIRTHNGRLRQALTVRNARGNVCDIQGNRITFGVDYGAVPYARYVIEGRGPVRVKRAKALRFYDPYGRVIFRKRVGPAPPHDVVYLRPDDLQRARDVVTKSLGGDWQFRRI